MFERLRKVPLFKGFVDSDLQELSSKVGDRMLAAGEVLFMQGDEGHDCYVILTGALEVITYMGGTEMRLEVRRAGEIIGEMALIDPSPRSATVRAVTDSHVAMLNEESFYAVLLSDSELAVEMLRRGTERLRSTSQRMITDLEAKNAELLRALEDLKNAQDELIYLNRIQEELSVARRIQKFFMPRTLPQPAGWQVAGFNRGAQAVGGDFYDCIPLPGNRLGMVVADAVGKGVSAALFVALTRSLLRAASQAPWAFQGDRALDPEAMLTGALWVTNDYIAREHGESNMFITVFYGIIAPESGTFAYVNVGHDKQFIIAADGKTLRDLESTCLPLGIIEEQTYESEQTTLAVGEVFVGFSDGVTEAMNVAGEMFSEERLTGVLLEHAHLDASDLVDIIVQQVDAHAMGAPQSDDITILVVKRVA